MPGAERKQTVLDDETDARKLTVRVVRAENGGGIAQADVTVLRSQAENDALWLASDSLGNAVTDASGHAVIWMPRGSRDVRILAVSPGRMPNSVRSKPLPEDGGGQPVILKLRRAIRVTGVVKTLDGAPVGALDVRLFAPRDPIQSIDGARAQDGVLADALFPRGTMTDSGGHFVIYGQPGAQNRLAINSADVVVVRISGLEPARTVSRDVDDVELTVAFRRYLHFDMVTKGGAAPVAASTVLLSAVEGGVIRGAPALLGGAGWPAYGSDVNLLEALRDNEILARVIVSKPQASARFVLTSPFLEKTLFAPRLLTAEQIRKRGFAETVPVTWRDGITERGDLVVGMDIPKSYRSRARRDRPRLRVLLGADATANVTELFLVGTRSGPAVWRFRGVPAGSREVQLELSGLQSERKIVEINRDREVSAKLTMLAPTGIRLSVGADGKPALDAIVTVRPLDGLMGIPPHMQSFRVDEATRRVLPNFIPLRPGRYRVRVQRPGAGFATRDVDVTNGSVIPIDVILPGLR